MIPAGQYTCICGHTLADHESPGGNAEPWGACRVTVAPTEPGPMTSCGCREAWPLEENS